jgi:hypothetical protein
MKVIRATPESSFLDGSIRLVVFPSLENTDTPVMHMSLYGNE